MRLTILALMIFSLNSLAGGFKCEALCLTHHFSGPVSIKAGSDYFSSEDAFELLVFRCPGILVRGPFYATKETSCRYIQGIPADTVPDYYGPAQGE